MQKKESFIINRLKSIGFAFKGMLILIKTEASIKIQVFIAIVVTIAGFYFDISKTEWIAQIGMIGLVMSMEGMNTAVEYIADFIHPEYHKKIGLIKRCCCWCSIYSLSSCSYYCRYNLYSENAIIPKSLLQTLANYRLIGL